MPDATDTNASISIAENASERKWERHAHALKVEEITQAALAFWQTGRVAADRAYDVLKLEHGNVPVERMSSADQERYISLVHLYRNALADHSAARFHLAYLIGW